MSSHPRRKVVIVGGGFGGVYSALELDKWLFRFPDVDVTVVNRDNFFLFTPMLHEVAASDLDITNIVNPVRKLVSNVEFFDGDVEKLDLAKGTVTVSHGDGHTHDLPYDHLVLSPGSVTNFFGLPGLEERAITMKSLGDAIALRNRMIEQLEEAETECGAPDRDHLMTFVVAGSMSDSDASMTAARATRMAAVASWASAISTAARNSDPARSVSMTAIAGNSLER